MIFAKFFHSVTGKISVYLLLGNLFLTVTMGFVAISYIQGQVAQQYQANYQNQMNRLTLSLVSPLWEFNSQQVQSIIESEMADSPLVGLMLNTSFIEERKVFRRDAHNKIVTQDFYPEARSEFSPNFLFQDRPIYKGDIFLGEATFIFSQVPMRNLVNTIVFTLLAFAILFLLINLLLAFWGVQKILLSPLQTLHRGVRAFSDNLKLRISLPGQDEVAQVADEFNQMAEQLGSAFRYQENLVGELSQLKNYLSLIIESNSSALAALDGTGSILHWNRAAEDLTRIPRDKALGHNLWSLVPSLARFQKHQILLEHRTQPLIFFHEKLDSESQKIFNVFLYPVQHPKNSGLVLRIDDISLQVHQEELLNRAGKMESMGSLAGGLAHNFNNILGSITGALSLLRHSSENSSPVAQGQIRDHLEHLEASTQRATALVSELLTLSPQTSNRFEDLDLHELLAEALRLFQAERPRGFQLKVELGSKPIWVAGDRPALVAMVLHLLNNAADSVERAQRVNSTLLGTISVALEVNPADRYFRDYHPEALAEGYASLTISDNGLGMSKDTQQRIFEPLFTTKPANKGRGLGLALVYHTLKTHQAFVDVYSEPGLGAVFTCHLALLRGLPRSEATNDQPHLPGTTILLADDDPFIRKIARDILEGLNCRVVTASDGQEALEVFRDQEDDIDLVILDWSMPKISGPELAPQLLKIRPGLRILMASGLPLESRMVPLLGLGVRACIKKPYTLKSMGEMVNAALSGK